MQEEAYWQAVVERDQQADGAFVFAVRSTGIYCKPSCPARRPRREQVQFFPSPDTAQEAGFRPCRRCKPEARTQEHPQLGVVQQLCRYIETHSEEQLTLQDLSAEVHLSTSHIQHLFKQVMGVTPHQYLQSCRMTQVKHAMKEGEAVTSAVYSAGYGSSSRLYEQAPLQLGMTPGTYRKGGLGMTIEYTIVDCSLGRLLVAATRKGICAVSMGDCDEQLEAALHREYPAATIEHDTADMSVWVETLVQHLNGQQPHLALPVDIQASAFQCRVWEELRAIPYGETRSYGAIAQRLGDVQKARAVANACASNPVALVIPCHRVIREDGNIGGYRWGAERKQRLLAQEQR